MPTLLKGYRALGGQMVLNQKIILGQSSYQPEVEKLIAARPQIRIVFQTKRVGDPQIQSAGTSRAENSPEVAERPIVIK